MSNNNHQPDNVVNDTDSNASINTTNTASNNSSNSNNNVNNSLNNDNNNANDDLTDISGLSGEDTDDTDDTYDYQGISRLFAEDNIGLRNTMVTNDYFINILAEDSLGSVTSEQFLNNGMSIADYLSTGNRVVVIFNENRMAMGVSYDSSCIRNIRFPNYNFTNPFIMLPAFYTRYFHYQDPLVQAICEIQSPFECRSFKFRKEGNDDVFFIRRAQTRRMAREITCNSNNTFHQNDHVLGYTDTEIWETVSHFNFNEYLRNPGLIATPTNRENIDTLNLRQRDPYYLLDNFPSRVSDRINDIYINDPLQRHIYGNMDLRAGGALNNYVERMRRTQNNIPISRQEPVVQQDLDSVQQQYGQNVQQDPLHLKTFIYVKQTLFLKKYLNSKLQTRSEIKIFSSTLFKVLVSPPKRHLDTLLHQDFVDPKDYWVESNDRVFKINKTLFCVGFLKFIYNIYQELSDKNKLFLGVDETFQLMNKPVSYRNVFKFQKKNKEIFLIIKRS